MTLATTGAIVLCAFQQNAHHAHEHPAILSGRGALSYGILWDRCRRLAHVLVDDGVRPGDRVALILDNSQEFVIAYLATLAAGAIAVPLNPRAPVATLVRVFEDCGPVAAFVSGSIVSAVVILAARFPEFTAAYSADPVRNDTGVRMLSGMMDRLSSIAPVGDLPPPAERETAIIAYTSGTTGTPKGVMLSHANLTAIAAAGRQLVELRASEPIGIAVPMFHLYGLREVDLALSTGATIVLPRETHFATTMLAEFRDAGIVGLSSVPSALGILLQRHRLELANCLRGLRYLTIGTAPMPSSTVAGLRDTLPHTRLITTYGLTEASRVCWTDVSHPAIPWDPHVVGRPYPGVELCLVDEVGGVGRVAVKSRMVMQGYWANAAATRAVMANGNLLTPDCGRIHHDGTLHLLGRLDDVINCGGQKVSPVEIEDVIASHPMVAAVTVLGIADPDGKLGEVVQAVIVRREGSSLTATDIQEFAATVLEPHKVPRYVEFVQEIPRSVLGKPRRVELRA